MRYLKILFFLCFVQNIFGQAITVEELTKMALEKHPAMKVTLLKIQQQELLRNTGFELAKTDFYYMGQALGAANDNVQHDFGAKQSFSLPKVYRAKNALIEAEINAVQQEKALTALEIRGLVMKTYWQIVAENQKIAALSSMDTFYTEFLNFARLRVKTGEANALEVLSIQAALNNLELQKAEFQQRYELSQRYLAFLVGREDWIDVTGVSIDALAIDVAGMTAKNHPITAYFEAQKQVAAQRVAVETAALAPEWRVGYASQIFNGQAGLNGVEVGVSVPLNKKPQLQRIEAAKMQTAILEAEAETALFQLESVLKQNFAALENLHGQIFQLDRLLYDVLPNVWQLTKMGYEKGEISYFEYVRILQQIADAQLEKYTLKQAYNDRVIDILLMQ
jgi:cobalt-zinc-cadmium resistance protein CzcA